MTYLDKPALAKAWGLSISTVSYAKSYSEDIGEPFFKYVGGRYTTLEDADKFLATHPEFTPSMQRQRRKDRAQKASCTVC